MDLYEVTVAPGFDFLSAEYAALFTDSQASAFQHPIWLDALYGQLAPRLDATPLIVTVRDSSDGRLAMVLPLLRRRHGGLRIVEFADLGVSDYACPVANQTTLDAVAASDATCAGIDAELRPFDLLRIQKLRSRPAQLQKILGTTACGPMAVSAYAVPLDSSFATWRTHNLTASYRKELEKKSRQLHRKGRIAFEVAEDPALIAASLARMRDYRQGRFETGDLLQNGIYFDFYLDVATRAKGSLVRLYTLSSDDALIAGAMGLSHRGSLLVILTGFDQDNYKRQSLGSLIFEMIAQHSIQQHDRELDFTIGDEPYKELFGARKSPVYQISRPGSVTGAIAEVVVQRMPWVKNIARQAWR